MEIKHIVEREDGTAVFQGVLTGKELAFVVEVGLNQLIAEGAIPFLMESEETEAVVQPAVDTLQ